MLSIWNLCWALLAASLVEKAGRRTLFLISSCGMLLFFSSETVCYAVFAQSGNTIDSAAHGVIAFIFLFYAMYDLAFTPLIVSYTLEILPYAVRAKGFNLFNLAITLSVLFNTYINPIALGTSDHATCISFLTSSDCRINWMEVLPRLRCGTDGRSHVSIYIPAGNQREIARRDCCDVR